MKLHLEAHQRRQAEHDFLTQHGWILDELGRFAFDFQKEIDFLHDTLSLQESQTEIIRSDAEERSEQV